jgi:hypothetical protein
MTGEGSPFEAGEILERAQDGARRIDAHIKAFETRPMRWLPVNRDGQILQSPLPVDYRESPGSRISPASEGCRCLKGAAV